MAEKNNVFFDFPEMDVELLRSIKKSIDASYKNFSREYGEGIESFFDPLLQFLVFFEKLLIATPWPILIIVFCVLAYLGSHSKKVVVGVILSFFAIGYFGMWDNTMRTISIIVVCTFMAVSLGIPIGIAMARSDRAQSAITPVLDIMQTMPSFVYLIPIVMLLGIGKVPGVIAVIIYAIPPVIRLTNLGIRLVDKEVLEAADAFGANTWQKLTRVQFPLALPTIFAGINQTIMMALAMVVIASMIGVKGLGQPVLKAITNQYFTLGVFNGLAIVALAIIFDRVSQSYGKRIQKHLYGAVNG
ncbi:proline/glycine betaine ABC transporter permease [Candidatus Persebacteraceae bacterium Df01]|jgi:glycine betaine/proline transport system permease protein|uniref:Proline/glycine betaine ABC transporter permease n=1 Tax=Candidatus Doriopsillibacter californiensis TaxID=2970740 RepID=A0ABT7QN71_9GAMM|nr:proline/glycine betaine ABC transporter permease [Candidatus Persebacteraceae bacterium Df01]